jgi:uncharacterized protein YoaH (UPF0181 family)
MAQPGAASLNYPGYYEGVLAGRILGPKHQGFGPIKVAQGNLETASAEPNQHANSQIDRLMAQGLSEEEAMARVEKRETHLDGRHRHSEGVRHANAGIKLGTPKAHS